MSLGLYVHLPICRSRCLYCDFYSQTDASVEAALVAALTEEVHLKAGRVPGRTVDTVYFGGGTPSLFKLGSLAALTNALAADFRLGSAGHPPEFTLECNPDDVSGDLINEYRQLGVNRISMGAQSFRDSELRLLGRRHDAERICRAIEDVRGAGIDNLSLDLIFALPGQTAAEFEFSINAAVALWPQHLSLYCLTIAPGTELAARVDAGLLVPAADELQADMLRLGSERLGAAGYRHYEVSNFAQPGWESRHNLNYWRRGDYLGFGPSAHSHLAGCRWANPADTAGYIKAIAAGQCPPEFEEELSVQQRAEELVMLSLRTADGLDLERYHATAGSDLLSAKRSEIESLTEAGLLELRGNCLKPTETGLLMAEEIAARLA